MCREARELLCSLFLPQVHLHLHTRTPAHLHTRTCTSQACCELLLHLSSTSEHTVTPKLVGTLRLVTQGLAGECRALGARWATRLPPPPTSTKSPEKASTCHPAPRPDLLACLVSISQFSLVPALAIETARLLASIVRWCTSAPSYCSCTTTTLTVSGWWQGLTHYS